MRDIETMEYWRQKASEAEDALKRKTAELAARPTVVKNVFNWKWPFDWDDMFALFVTCLGFSALTIGVTCLYHVITAKNIPTSCYTYTDGKRTFLKGERPWNSNVELGDFEDPTAAYQFAEKIGCRMADK